MGFPQQQQHVVIEEKGDNKNLSCAFDGGRDAGQSFHSACLLLLFLLEYFVVTFFLSFSCMTFF